MEIARLLADELLGIGTGAERRMIGIAHAPFPVGFFRRADRPFARAMVQESLRLWPTTPLILRRTTADTDWGGRTLPAGSGVMRPPVLLKNVVQSHGAPAALSTVSPSSSKIVVWFAPLGAIENTAVPRNTTSAPRIDNHLLPGGCDLLAIGTVAVDTWLRALMSSSSPGGVISAPHPVRTLRRPPEETPHEP